MQQNWYQVMGEYGPLGGMCISYYIFTRSEYRARPLFEKRVKRDYGESTWSLMGQRNTAAFLKSPQHKVGKVNSATD